MQQSQGKTISIYLMDGTSEGRWKASLANWNGVGYRIPRDEVKNCGDIADLKKPGVYFLFGNEIETGRTFIYIGEADAVRTRIMQPHTFEERGDSWTGAVIFVTTDDSLEKGRVKYLENRFYTLAVDAGRYLVETAILPNSRLSPRQCVTRLRVSSAMSGSFFPLWATAPSIRFLYLCLQRLPLWKRKATCSTSQGRTSVSVMPSAA